MSFIVASLEAWLNSDFFNANIFRELKKRDLQISPDTKIIFGSNHR